MDLLTDIGAEDQLISGMYILSKEVFLFACLPRKSYSHLTHSFNKARTENATLKQKVKELTEQVKELTVDNASLLAEVEMYRKEAALPTFSKLALGKDDDDKMDTTDDNNTTGDDFVRAGNGVSMMTSFLLSIWYSVLTTLY